MDLFKSVQYLYPDLDESKVAFSIDGENIRISLWNTSYRKPSIAELTAIWYNIERDILLEQIRVKRNLLLNESDWTQLPDCSLTTTLKQKWATYRQQLRDLPETCNPYDPAFPVKPS